MTTRAPGSCRGSSFCTRPVALECAGCRRDLCDWHRRFTECDNRKRHRADGEPVERIPKDTGAPSRPPGQSRNTFGGRKRDPQRDAEVAWRFKAGETPASIARAAKCCERTVYNTLVHLGLWKRTRKESA